MVLYPATAVWGRRVRTGQVHVTASFPRAHRFWHSWNETPSAYAIRMMNKSSWLPFPWFSLFPTLFCIYPSTTFFKGEGSQSLIWSFLIQNLPIPLVIFSCFLSAISNATVSVFEMEGQELDAVFKWQIFKQEPQRHAQWHHVVFWLVFYHFPEASQAAFVTSTQLTLW